MTLIENQLISCRLRFYCVDVNMVPHKLVARAGVTVSHLCSEPTLLRTNTRIIKYTHRHIYLYVYI